MRKYDYSIWFPNMNYHGDLFSKLSEDVQNKIEQTLNFGYLIPTSISIDVGSDKILLSISNNEEPVEFDEETEKAFRDWVSKLKFVAFASEAPKLNRYQKEAE